MKQILAKILVGIMVTGMLLTGCGSEEKKEVSLDIEIERAEDVLVKVWASYDEKDKFAIVGGNVENMAWGVPCEFNLQATDEAEYTLCVPAEGVELLDNAASLADEMDSHVFTGGVLCLKESANVNKLGTLIKDCISQREWGEESAAEKYVIAKAYDNYVIVAYGTKDNVNTFKNQMKSQVDASVLHEGSIK